MKNLFSFLLIMFTVSLFGQTPVSGTQSGTWSVDGSPYQVTGEITVPSGETLTVEAGVTVLFQGHCKFTVHGKLVAAGTETDSIFFTAENTSTGWGGIRIDGSQVSELSYCRLEYGKTAGNYPDNHGGALALLTADAVVSNCVFANNTANGDDDGMGGAVYAFNTGSASAPITKFTDCKFIDNHAYGEGGAIKFTGDMNTEITRCEFIGNNCNYGGGAISFYSVIDTKMSFCLFVNNFTNYSNGGAIHTLGMGNTLIIENCTMYGNSANGGDGGAVNLAYASATFVNSIIYNNPGTYSSNINLDFDGYAEINYCDVPMPDGATGSNNINVNPQFVDVTALDFHLQEISECIDAGTYIGYEYIGEAPDMGCFEYDPSIGFDDYLKEDFTVFPNPSGEIINFEIGDDEIQSVDIVDIKGNVVLQNKDVRQNRINISSLKTGIYFVTVRTTTGSFTKRIVKE